MTQLFRPVGYTGTLQRLTIPENFGATITAYLWGGGGGGGGGDYISPKGGNGTGGSYTQTTISVVPGDVLDIAIGGGGGGGRGQRGTAPGGTPGPSYVAALGFNLADVIGTRVSNGAWCTFLNTYGVWGGASNWTWDNTIPVEFPASDYYTFTSSCDNYATIYVDGVAVMTAPDYTESYTKSIFVTAGTRSIRVLAENYGGPGGVGLLISTGNSYNGGRGGLAGPAGSSGAGGGGGGATVLLLNGNPVAVAGGGGGGGGCGSTSGQNSPGTAGQSITSHTGQDGQDKGGDGGGGGAGGGGVLGGNGGGTRGGDVGAGAGTYGSSSGSYISEPSGITPGNSGSPYYSGNPGTGGRGSNGDGFAGTAGYALLEFDVAGTYVHHNGSYTSVNTTYIKNNDDVWVPVKAAWINDGTWKQVQGSAPPVFTSIATNYGITTRTY